MLSQMVSIIAGRVAGESAGGVAPPADLPGFWLDRASHPLSGDNARGRSRVQQQETSLGDCTSTRPNNVWTLRRDQSLICRRVPHKAHRLSVIAAAYAATYCH